MIILYIRLYIILAKFLFISIRGKRSGTTESETVFLDWIAFPFFRNISQKFQN
jgi:hypothetical protein